jgi:hypothetical protein
MYFAGHSSRSLSELEQGVSSARHEGEKRAFWFERPDADNDNADSEPKRQRLDDPWSSDEDDSLSDEYSPASPASSDSDCSEGATQTESELFDMDAFLLEPAAA